MHRKKPQQIMYRFERIIILSRANQVSGIIDGLGQLSLVLETRGKLGLFDLNRYCEDFANAESLNLQDRFVNLNFNLLTCDEIRVK